MALLIIFTAIMALLTWNEAGLDYFADKYPTVESYARAGTWDRISVIFLAGPIYWVCFFFAVTNSYIRKILS